MPFEHNDFEWELKDCNTDQAQPLYVVGENGSGVVSLANAEGAAIAELDTRWNQVCTVVQFWWDAKSYRWALLRRFIVDRLQLPASGCSHVRACAAVQHHLQVWPYISQMGRACVGASCNSEQCSMNARCTLAVHLTTSVQCLSSCNRQRTHWCSLCNPGTNSAQQQCT